MISALFMFLGTKWVGDWCRAWRRVSLFCNWHAGQLSSLRQAQSVSRMTAALQSPATWLDGSYSDTKAGGEAERDFPPRCTDVQWQPLGLQALGSATLPRQKASPGLWQRWGVPRKFRLTDSPASSNGAWPWADFRQPGAFPQPQTACPQMVISQVQPSHLGY